MKMSGTHRKTKIGRHQMERKNTIEWQAREGKRARGRRKWMEDLVQKRVTAGIREASETDTGRLSVEGYILQ